MKILDFIKLRRKLLIKIIFFSAIGLYLLFSDYGFIKKIKLKNEKQMVISKIEIEQKKQDSLKHIINMLTNDKNEIERIARLQYGMIKPGEKIFIVDTSINK